MFRALVESEGSIGRDVRRPLALHEIAAIAGTDVASLRPVIEAFRSPGRNFLTPAPPAPLTADTVIDISHESLIRQWGTLRTLVHEEFQSASTYRHIATTAKYWNAGQEGRLRMPYLSLALEWRRREHPNAAWASRYGGDFDLAIRYLESSRRLSLWRTGGSAAVVALLLLGAIGFGYYQFRAAEKSADQLDSAKTQLKAARGQLQILQENLERTQSELGGVNLGDELTDFGVAPQNTLQENIGTPTPRTIPGGAVLTTRDLGSVLGDTPPPILIDVWDSTDSHAVTIPSAIRIAFAGKFGDFNDADQARLEVRLKNLTDNNKSRTLVFFCVGPKMLGIIQRRAPRHPCRIYARLLVSRRPRGMGGRERGLPTYLR